MRINAMPQDRFLTETDDRPGRLEAAVRSPPAWLKEILSWVPSER